MSATSDFYLARAAECNADAAAAKLSNVRDRCLRSAAAWQSMAERILYTEAARAERDSDKERDRQLIIEQAEAHLG